MIWRWSLVAGWLGQASLFALTLGLGHLVPLGYGFQKVFLGFPSLGLIAILLMLAAMSGVVEEAAFRGYMQGLIEKRHGPVLAIAVVSMVFGLGHLVDWQPQMTIARMCLIIAVWVQYGILAHLTGSILPGVVIHAAGDALGILLLWWLSAYAGSRPSRVPAGRIRGGIPRSVVLGELRRGPGPRHGGRLVLSQAGDCYAERA